MYCSDKSLSEIYKNQIIFQKSFNTLIDWIKQIAIALRKIHYSNIIDTKEYKWIHRDLKPNNILIHNNNIYLSDFGTVKELTLKNSNQLDSDSIVGTSDWAAPEMRIPQYYNNKIPHYNNTEKSDIYALGLIMYSMIIGEKTSAQVEISKQIYGNGKPIPGAEKKSHSLFLLNSVLYFLKKKIY